MKIAVCIKPVRTELAFPSEQSSEPFSMNPYDLYALEQCIALKKKINCTVSCVCLGPDSAESMLRKTFAMGADEAIHISDRAFAGSDTVATSYILHKAIIKLGSFDLIVCGNKTIDGETGQVAPGLAERLDMECVSDLLNISCENENEIIAEQNSADSCNVIRLSLPAVVSFDNFTTKHPKISLLAMKRAKNKSIEKLGIDDINADKALCGLSGSKTQVLNVKDKMAKKTSTIVPDDPKEQAKLIISIMSGEEIGS